MPQPYQLSILEENDKKIINFANNSPDFIEMLFLIDGREAKDGKFPDNSTRGNGYPPKLEKLVKKMRDGTPLRLSTFGGKVQAKVYPGVGSYKDEDLDKPTFMRHELVDKFTFRRVSDQPIAVLEVQY